MADRLAERVADVERLVPLARALRWRRLFATLPGPLRQCIGGGAHALLAAPQPMPGLFRQFVRAFRQRSDASDMAAGEPLSEDEATLLCCMLLQVRAELARDPAAGAPATPALMLRVTPEEIRQAIELGRSCGAFDTVRAELQPAGLRLG